MASLIDAASTESNQIELKTFNSFVWIQAAINEANHSSHLTANSVNSVSIISLISTYGMASWIMVPDESLLPLV